MDERWYHRKGENDDVVQVSRIRLLRNFKKWKFPARMSEEERTEMLRTVDEKLPRLQEILGQPVQKLETDELIEEEKLTLQERLLINKATLEQKKRAIVYASADEAFSMTVGGSDHLRLLLSEHGQGLGPLYELLSEVDSYIDSRIPFAYSKKVGYETSSLQNVGTGMRAYYVMHLPLLSESRNFQTLSREMIKFGVVMKEAWISGAKKIGGLYVLYNQRTLGMKEQDLMDILTNVAVRLTGEERELREKMPDLMLRDRVLRSYGILLYAEQLDFPEACQHLSNLLLGVSTGILSFTKEMSIYELMLGIFPGNLQYYFKQKADDQKLRRLRSQYLKEYLEYIEMA
ncbi:MAG: hypothetical protein IKS18_04350 [Lachnospiraceae bacterium]|nr:hypothetical protein [Lachnospiraceae bacterium]